MMEDFERMLAAADRCSAQGIDRISFEPMKFAHTARAYIANELEAERERWREILSHTISELQDVDNAAAQVQAEFLREMLGP